MDLILSLPKITTARTLATAIGNAVESLVDTIPASTGFCRTVRARDEIARIDASKVRAVRLLDGDLEVSSDDRTVNVDLGSSIAPDTFGAEGPYLAGIKLKTSGATISVTVDAPPVKRLVASGIGATLRVVEVSG